ncbi:hypothetical protein CJD36_002885 [Flavipsychrobacter stenotrophus]|uniref:Lipoprotein n=1 Tax=Flavipsychrobacter stenotrophus TaxID=2077091 RepID=A0A2S7T1H6_9BACT|nr:hypothetical protein [Flavipsychrobacter stenotrophus]PQJ12707.1 hypothetical protein CJD36_002885 [Flavipsychrobacter stenotrophus]
MKKYYLLLLLILAVCMFTACSKSKNSGPTTNTDTTYTGYYCDLDKDYIHYHLRESTLSKYALVSMSVSRYPDDSGCRFYLMTSNGTSDISNISFYFYRMPDNSFRIDSLNQFATMMATDPYYFNSNFQMYSHPTGTVIITHLGTDYFEGSFNAVFKNSGSANPHKRVIGSFKMKRSDH